MILDKKNRPLLISNLIQGVKFDSQFNKGNWRSLSGLRDKVCLNCQVWNFETFNVMNGAPNTKFRHETPHFDTAWFNLDLKFLYKAKIVVRFNLDTRLDLISISKLIPDPCIFFKQKNLMLMLVYWNESIPHWYKLQILTNTSKNWFLSFDPCKYCFSDEF